MSCDITDEQFSRFIDGSSDELFDHVAECESCQARMEEGADDHLIEQTMRAVRLDSSTRELVATVMDVGSRLGRALARYAVRN